MTHVVWTFAWLAGLLACMADTRRIGGVGSLDGAELAALDGSMESHENSGSWEEVIRESGGVPKALVVLVVQGVEYGVHPSPLHPRQPSEPQRPTSQVGRRKNRAGWKRNSIQFTMFQFTKFTMRFTFHNFHTFIIIILSDRFITPHTREWRYI